MQFLVHQIGIALTEPESAALSLARQKVEAVCGKYATRTVSVYRRSVDARHTGKIRLVYSVLVEADATPAQTECLLRRGIESIASLSSISPVYGTQPMTERPVVVGFGPGGIFCALLLAQHGYRPIVLERGANVEERTRAVAHFTKMGILDSESNVQFGAGGAGTFSDGKLVTRIHDPYCHYVLEQFSAFGAPAEVLTQAKPHIGTDRLKKVVAAMEAQIVALGGEVHYHTKVTGILKKGERAIAVSTDRGPIPCGAVILAVGHSARDVYAFLQKDGYALVPKPFSVGVRIEHLQQEIDRALYGADATDPRLHHAEYALSHRQKDSVGEERCVYTFCMCPGGTVMASASEAGGVVTNGMSEYARDGRNANSALVVSVTPQDCARMGTDGVGFQRHLEQLAFSAGKGDYRAPAQTVGDFLTQRQGTAPTKILPTYRQGEVTLCDLHTLLPPYVTQMLEVGLRRFEKKITGFADPHAILTGTETRTSAPYRFLRDAQTYTSPQCENLYPCGEGAGYAGGITSAAVDGIRCAVSLMQRYAPYHLI